MSTENFKGAIEAILFASGSSVEASRIAQALEISEKDAIKYLEELKNEYENSQRGITIIKLKESYQMVSVKEFAPQIRKVMDLRRNTPLSQAALEVLAVIAYNQPVTKSFVEQIRGVDCSGVIGSLTTKDLIEEKGRLELPGRPLIYGTTENFLRCFNISSIEELPPLPEDNKDPEDAEQPTAESSEENDEIIETTVEEVIEQATAE
jgi:segregation and condensation protein B